MDEPLAGFWESDELLVDVPRHGASLVGEIGGRRVYLATRAATQDEAHAWVRAAWKKLSDG